MKLTDDQIEEYSDEWENDITEKGLFACSGSFTSGAMWARDIYDNQKCETCKENGQCSIQVGLEEYAYKSFPIDEKDFGCNQWEPKK